MIIIGKWAVLKLKYLVRIRLVNKEKFSVSNNRQSMLSIILNFNLKINIHCINNYEFDTVIVVL